MRNHIKALTLIVVMCVLAMSAVGTALAQDPYRNVGEQVQGNVQGGAGGGDGQPVGAQTVSGGADDGGALPFTGLDVALILGVGGVLLAVGLGTRRLTRPSNAA